MARITEQDVRRRLEENKRIFTEHFDAEYASAVVENVMHILLDVYFRVRYIGFDEIRRNNPEHPVIMVSNHSGMCFPWDGMMFMAHALRANDYDSREVPRPLVAKMLSKVVLMNPYLIPYLWKRCGGVDATYLNFETMMEHSHANVMLYPEGVPGIGKGFNRRYDLQRFATSFARMALKHQTDVVPYATINGEYLNPYTYSFPWVNRLMSKIFIPFLPIGLQTPFLLIFPWLFYYAMPARLTFVKCRRIPVGELCDKPPGEVTEEDVRIARDKVKASMQQDLDNLLERYGRRPYEWKHFWGSLWKNRRYFPFMFPFAWPLLFAEFERQWRRKQRSGQDIEMSPNIGAVFTYLVRNPFAIFYYIPIIGWIPLLIRGYRRQDKT